MDDLRLAYRQVLRRPLMSAAAIVTLALGMGLNAVVFSAVNAFFLKGAAGTQLEGTAWIVTTGPRETSSGVSIEEFERFSAATAGALRTSVMGRMPLAWQRERTSETVWAQIVSDDYFPLLEEQPIAGRLPRATDAGDLAETAVSERFWRERLGATDIGDLRVTFNNVEHAVVGVIDERFRGPGGTFAPDVWTLLDRWQELRLPATLGGLDRRWLGMIGRVEPTANRAEVEARLSSVAATLAREHPGSHEQRGVRVLPMRDGHPAVHDLRWLALVAMSGTGLVLLLACFNVASLLVARGVERRHEMGIRAALGASRARLVRQMIAEGLVLSVAAGAVTAIIASWSQRLLAAFTLPSPIPQRLDLSLDGRSLAFIGALIVLTGVLPGLLPAFQAARADLVRALTGGGAGDRSRSRGRKALLVTEIAGSTVLLIGAAIFVQTAVGQSTADPGFETTNALLLEIEPSMQGYDAARSRLLVDRLAAQLRTAPGIVDVAIADRVPFYVGYARMTPASTSPGACATMPCAGLATYAVGDGFFRTMGIPLVAGREVERERDAVVVGESLARDWWPGRSAVGEVIYLGTASRPHVVTGVARDVRHRSLTESTATPTLYVPLADADFERALTIVARTSRPPGPLVPAAADAARQVDPDVPPRAIKTMAERMALPRWPARTASSFFGICGGLALLLATVGLFALVTQSVQQRTREFGLRLAIGASRTRLARDVLLDGAAVVTTGTIAGALIAAASAHAASTVFPGIDALSPTTYLAVAVVQGAVALAACLAPARRAASVDPAISLRTDG